MFVRINGATKSLSLLVRISGNCRQSIPDCENYWKVCTDCLSRFVRINVEDSLSLLVRINGNCRHPCL